MFTEQVLAALHCLDESPWSDLRGEPLDARGLANRLRQYEIHSTAVRINDKVAKGYKRTGSMTRGPANYAT